MSSQPSFLAISENATQYIASICKLPNVSVATSNDMPVGLKDLNISIRYAETISGFHEFREVVQNWHDRVLELLGGEPHRCCEILEKEVRMFWHERDVGDGKQCAGYLLEHWKANQCAGMHGIELVNFMTAFPLTRSRLASVKRHVMQRVVLVKV